MERIRPRPRIVSVLAVACLATVALWACGGDDDDDPDRLLLAADSGGLLYRMNTERGTGHKIGPTGFQDVTGLAFDPATNTIYGVDDLSQRLLVLRRKDGAATPVGNLGFPAGSQTIQGLAFDSNAGVLYGVSNNAADNIVLWSIDTATGLATLVSTSAAGVPEVTGLAYDPGADLLYAIARGGGLWQTTPAAASFNQVATTFAFIEGIAFDTKEGALWGLDDAGDLLVRIDPATGVATAVRPGGSLGFPTPRALTINK